MGQKVNPISYRLQVNRDWSSKWFSKKAGYKNWLVEDTKIRDYVENRFSDRPTISRVKIERSPNLTTINIATAKAGAVIGRQGAGTKRRDEYRDDDELWIRPVRFELEPLPRSSLCGHGVDRADRRFGRRFPEDTFYVPGIFPQDE